MMSHLTHHAKRAHKHVSKYKHHYLASTLVVAFGFLGHFVMTERTSVSAAGTEVSVVNVDSELEVKEDGQGNAVVAGLKLTSSDADKLTEIRYVVDAAGKSPENIKADDFTFVGLIEDANGNGTYDDEGDNIIGFAGGISGIGVESTITACDLIFGENGPEGCNPNPYKLPASVNSDYNVMLVLFEDNMKKGDEFTVSITGYTLASGDAMSNVSNFKSKSIIAVDNETDGNGGGDLINTVEINTLKNLSTTVSIGLNGSLSNGQHMGFFFMNDDTQQVVWPTNNTLTLDNLNFDGSGWDIIYDGDQGMYLFTYSDTGDMNGGMVTVDTADGWDINNKTNVYAVVMISSDGADMHNTVVHSAQSATVTCSDCSGGDDAPPPDDSVLELLETSIIEGEQDVAVDTEVIAVFSADVDEASLAANVTLVEDGVFTNLCDSVTYPGAPDNFTAVQCNTLAPLETDTNYIFSIVGKADGIAAGEARLSQTESVNFTTVSGGGEEMPELSLNEVIPGDGASDILLDDPITASFSSDLDASTVSVNTVALLLNGEGDNLCTSVTVDGNSLECVYSLPLTASKLYSFVVQSGKNGVLGSKGEELSKNVTSNFITGSGVVLPELDAATPSEGSSDIATSTEVTGIFTLTLDPSTVSTNSVWLVEVAEGVPVPPSLCTSVSMIENNTGVSCVHDDLATSTDYMIIFSNTLADTKGNNLAKDARVNFSTTAGVVDNGKDDPKPDPSSDATEAIGSDPNDSAQGVFVEKSNFYLYFDGTIESESVDDGNDGLFQLSGAGGDIVGENLCTSLGLGGGSESVSCTASALEVNTYYRLMATVMSTDGVTEITSITEFRSSATANRASDPPRITNRNPRSGSTNVPTDTKISVTYDTGMHVGDGSKIASVINHVNYDLREADFDGQPKGSDLCTEACQLSASMDSEGRSIVSLGIESDLEADTEYILVIQGEITDSAGVSMGTSVVSYFRTGTESFSDAFGELSFDMFPPNGATVPVTTAAIELWPSSPSLAVDTITTDNIIFFEDANANGVFDVGETKASDVGSILLDYDAHHNKIVATVPGILPTDTQICASVLANGVSDHTGQTLDADWNGCFLTDSTDFEARSPELAGMEADQFNVKIWFNSPINAAKAVVTSSYTFFSPSAADALVFDELDINYDPSEYRVDITGVILETSNDLKVTVKNQSDPTDTKNMVEASIYSNVRSGSDLHDDWDFDTEQDHAEWFENPVEFRPENLTAGEDSGRFILQFQTDVDLPVGSQIKGIAPVGYVFSENTRLIPTEQSFNNRNIKGYGLETTISTTSVNISTRSITFTTAGYGIAAGDYVSLEFYGVTNPSNAGGEYMGRIQVFDENGKNVGSYNTKPVRFTAAGAISVKGTVYADANDNGRPDDGEGIENAIVFCNARHDTMRKTDTTGADGSWEITGMGENIKVACGLNPNPDLFASQYPIVDYREIFVGAENVTGQDFTVSVDQSNGVGTNIDMTLDGNAALASVEVDVNCHWEGRNMIKTVTLDNSGDGTTTFALPRNKHVECSVEPHVDPSLYLVAGGAPTIESEFSTSRQEFYTGDPTAPYFKLETFRYTLPITVVGTDDEAISGAFIGIIPRGCYNEDTGSLIGCEPRDFETNGSRKDIPVNPGLYEVAVLLNGAPPSELIGVSVEPDGTLYSSGIEITKNSPLVLTLAKSSLTISGTYLRGEDPVPYAHISLEQIQSGTTCNTAIPLGRSLHTVSGADGDYIAYVNSGTWMAKAGGACAIMVVGDTSLTGKSLVVDTDNEVTIQGSALPDAIISGYGATGGGYAIASSEGTYTMNVLAGSVDSIECYSHDFGFCGFESVNSNANQTVNFETSVDTGTLEVTALSGLFVEARNNRGGNGTGDSNDGVYTLTLPPGTYRLHANNPQVGDVCNNVSVTITKNETTEISCSPEFDIVKTRGQVVDTFGNNVAGASVAFINVDNGQRFLVTSDGRSTGTNISASTISAGSYRIIARKSGYESATVEAVIDSSLSEILEQLVLTPATGSNGDSLTVTVNSSGGSAYAGISRVVAEKQDGSGNRIIAEVTKATGQATLALTNGTWNIWARGEAEESAMATRAVQDGSLIGGNLTLTLNQAITGVDGPLSDGVAINSIKEGFRFESTDIPMIDTMIVPPSSLDASDTSAGILEIKQDSSIGLYDPGVGQSVVGEVGVEITILDASGNKEGSSLAEPISLTMNYTDADVVAAGVREDKLQIFAVNANGELETFSSTVDTDNNKITAQVTHLSGFGILGGGGNGGGDDGGNEGEEIAGGGSSFLGVAPPALPPAIEKTPAEMLLVVARKDAPEVFTIGGATHTLTVLLTTENEVAFTVESSPVSLSLEMGESEIIDADDDGVLDLYVEYLSGTGDGRHTFKFINMSDENERLTAFSVHAGRYETTDRNVDLVFNVETAAEMLVSEDPTFADVQMYIPYVERMDFRLSNGNGVKTVYVRVRSAEGGTVDVSDTIILSGQTFDQEVVEVTETEEETTIVSCVLKTLHAYMARDNAAVYYITNACTKRPFKTAKVFFSYFTSWGEVENTTSEVLDIIPNDSRGFMTWGPKYNPSSGELLQLPNDPKVYWLLGNTVYQVENVAAAVYQFGPSWKDLLSIVDTSVLSQFNSGDTVLQSDNRPDGILIKYENDPKVYRLETVDGVQTKRWVTTESTFNKLKYLWKRVITIPATEQYVDGANID